MKNTNTNTKTKTKKNDFDRKRIKTLFSSDFFRKYLHWNFYNDDGDDDENNDKMKEENDILLQKRTLFVFVAVFDIFMIVFYLWYYRPQIIWSPPLKDPFPPSDFKYILNWILYCEIWIFIHFTLPQVFYVFAFQNAWHAFGLIVFWEGIEVFLSVFSKVIFVGMGFSDAFHKFITEKPPDIVLGDILIGTTTILLWRWVMNNYFPDVLLFFKRICTWTRWGFILGYWIVIIFPTVLISFTSIKMVEEFHFLGWNYPIGYFLIPLGFLLFYEIMQSDSLLMQEVLKEDFISRERIIQFFDYYEIYLFASYFATCFMLVPTYPCLYSYMGLFYLFTSGLKKKMKLKEKVEEKKTISYDLYDHEDNVIRTYNLNQK
jgi:hypothetical protein